MAFGMVACPFILSADSIFLCILANVILFPLLGQSSCALYRLTRSSSQTSALGFFYTQDASHRMKQAGKGTASLQDLLRPRHQQLGKQTGTSEQVPAESAIFLLTQALVYPQRATLNRPHLRPICIQYRPSTGTGAQYSSTARLTFTPCPENDPNSD